jgi:hypothetical protein
MTTYRWIHNDGDDQLVKISRGRVFFFGGPEPDVIVDEQGNYITLRSPHATETTWRLGVKVQARTAEPDPPHLAADLEPLGKRVARLEAWMDRVHGT